MTVAVDEILADVFRLLAQRAGMAAEPMGTSGLAIAVRKRISASGEATPQDYVRRLAIDNVEFQELIEELVVPETWIFRDPMAFRSLTSQLEVARTASRGVFRVLSAGCSTGEEVYSLAMTLRSAGFTPRDYSVLGTDINRRSLELARKGTFGTRSFRQPDPTFRTLCEEWCEPMGEAWRVRDELRCGVEFRWENLARPEYLAGETPFEVIFCRNVLIYFHAEARRTAVGNLKRLLGPDGLLYLAPSEASIFSEAGFRSLGRECPFAFRPPSGSADPPQEAATKPRLSAKSESCMGNGRPFSPGTCAGRPPAASSRAKRVIGNAGAPSNPPTKKEACQALLDAAKQAADNGRLEEADVLCSQVLLQYPASAGAHCLRGVIRQAQGELAQAQQSLEKALYLEPQHYEALIHLMLLAQQRGDQRGAANYRRRAEQALPGSVP